MYSTEPTETQVGRINTLGNQSANGTTKSTSHLHHMVASRAFIRITGHLTVIRFKLNQYGRRHAFFCDFDCAQGYYSFELPDPKSATAVTQAYVSQYFCGEYSCSWEVNLIGYARHNDLTMDPYTYFTTSDGYYNYIDPDPYF